MISHSKVWNLLFSVLKSGIRLPIPCRVPRALVTVSDFALVYKGEWLNDQVKNLFFHVIIIVIFPDYQLCIALYF